MEELRADVRARGLESDITFTGHRSERSLAIYQRLGYVPFREERGTDGLTLVYLEKGQGR